MTILPNKPPFWLSSIALCLFLSCGQNVISIDLELTVQQDPIELAEDSDTLLHRAILGQADLDYIKILLQFADVNQTGNHAETALHLAAKQGNIELVKMLLDYQADVQAKNLKGQTPLHHAAFQGKFENIQALLTNKANTEAKDTQGQRPLHHAAFWGRSEALQVLLFNKAAIEAKDNLDRTPLHLAALRGQVAAVQLLINHQAPTWVIDYKGRTPYDLAWSRAVKQLLGRHMNLSKLIFYYDYDNIGKKILDYLTTKDRGKLRQTCTEIGWNLLRQGAFCLQVTPDKLRHLRPATYPRLYPHGQKHQDGFLTFHPIPVDAVVRGVWDWQYMSNDERLLIKNVVFIGRKVRTLQQLRQTLPLPLIDHLIVSAEIRAKEEKKLARRKARKAAYVEEKPIPMEEEPPSEDPYSVPPCIRPSTHP